VGVTHAGREETFMKNAVRLCLVTAVLIAGIAAPAAAQLRIALPADAARQPVAASSENALQIDAATANLGGAIILGWFQGGANFEDGYGRFKADVVGEVGLFSWSEYQQRRTPTLFASNQGTGTAAGPRAWLPSVLGSFSYIKGDFASAVAFMGGFRMTRRPAASSSKLRFFGQVLAGLQHDEFENALTVQPGGGIIVPMTGKKYLLTAGFNYGLTFYEGFTGKGPGFYGGIGIPLRGN
jgi:hypothetical protein